MLGVNIEFYRRDKDPDKVISERDRLIDGYIRAIDREECDDVLLYDIRADIKSLLGSERRSAISWYPFKQGCRILEVGGEFGAITGELCDKASRVVVTESSLFRAESIANRYKRRDNLEVYVGDIIDMEFLYCFDYIIIMDMVNKIGNRAVSEGPYLRAFEHLKKFLAKDGKLLLADENLYSIQRCQQEKGSLNASCHLRLLHKKQISDILINSGFPFTQFFYPLPGYRVVGRIYSDKQLPTAMEWNCLANYGNGNQNFLANNMDMISKLTDNGMFSYLAPAFFIEAGRTDTLSDIEKVNVLFDESYELPYLGFDWKQHGYSSLAGAIEAYRLKQTESVKEPGYEIQQKRFKSRVCKIDQDHEVLEKVIEVQLDLLQKLKQVCDAHGLKVYAMYGTLLGAVRCAGIIPGDDDIDVALSREDYNKLLTLGSEFSGEYFLQTPANDECFYGGYLKLRNKNTTAIHPQNWWTNCCEGIGIDIFPLDSGYADKAKERKKCWKIKQLQRLLYAKAYGYFPDFKDMKLLKWKSYKYIGKLFSREELANRLNLALQENDGSGSAPFGIYAHYLERGVPKLLDKNAFKESSLFAYEGIGLYVPMGWDKTLKMLYGDNYMQPKAWAEGKRRHGFYAVDEPYKKYKERFRNLFRPLPDGKKIVLFGDGLLYEAYFDKFGNERMPAEIVSLTDIVVDKQIRGIKVKSIAEFLQTEHNDLYPVICALDVRKAQRQLQEIGIEEYHIFWKVREWMLLANYTFALNELAK